MSAADPAHDTTSIRNVFVATSAAPTIKERILKEVLERELCRNEISVADDSHNADWVIALTHQRETNQFGSTTSTVVIPGTFISAFSTSRPNVVSTAYVHVYLFSAADFRTSSALPVWEAQVSTHAEVFRVYQEIVLQPAISFMGRTTERRIRLDKSYLREATHSPECKTSRRVSGDEFVLVGKADAKNWRHCIEDSGFPPSGKLLCKGPIQTNRMHKR